MKSKLFALVCVLLCINSALVNAKVTQYVPSSINKQIELDIDRIMLSANMPALKRPLAVSKVEKALAKACSKNIILEACKSVNNWLYKLKSQGWTSSGQLNVRYSTGANQNFIENAKGEYLDSSWNAQYQVSGLINNYLAVSIGGQAWQSASLDFNPEGSYLSLGSSWGQFDLGYKSHWWSPFKHSAMIISSNAPTFANVSFSNSVALTSFNFHYEFFVGEMSESDRIYYSDGYITGKPLLSGVHFSLEPFTGFTLGLNRLMQSGGGRSTNGLGDILAAFFDPAGADNTHADLDKDHTTRVSIFM